ncbi:MAG: AbrB/MazE/SpoVT family DNA-binding domain-containing protein [Candidatus Freyarchaeum deiterrae]
MGRAKIEERGKIQIPKEIRDMAGFRPGEEVEVEFENGKVVIKPLIDLEKFSNELKGCVNKSIIQPLDAKKIWKQSL